MLRTFVLIALFATVIASVSASAASLGGVTAATGGTIGSNTVGVSSCDTDGVTTSYTTAYDATIPAYEITSVTVAGINAACNTGTVYVTLAKSDNTAIATLSTAADATGSVTINSSASQAKAEDLTNVYVAIKL